MNLLISRVWAFYYRNFVIAKRNVFAFFEILFWPAVGIISVGLMGNFLKLDGPTVSFLLTGAIVSGVLQISQLDVAYGLLYDVWSKSIKQTFLPPVTNFDYIMGSWLFGIARGIIVFFLLAVFSMWAFDFSMPSFSITVVSLSGVFLNALIVGMVVNVFIMQYGQKVDIIAWSFPVLQMLVCGIYYPVTFLPKYVAVVAELMPLTYFLEYFRTAYGYQPVLSLLLLKGFGLSAMYVALMFFLMHVSYKKAQKNGMLIRLSE